MNTPFQNMHDENMRLNQKLDPVGVMPREIWIERRKQDLKAAIIRYLESDLLPPNEWYEELEDLIRHK